jgi:alkylation response protein AidB-like acyl-CoA dehydrogenase
MSMYLSSAQVALRERAREFADRVLRPRSQEIDRSGEYPWDVVSELAAAGYCGITMPERFGGAGASYLDAVVIIEEFAKACTVSARIMVEANMGAISAVMAYGTDEQRDMAGKLVREGDKPAICITEPDAGTDARAMTTRADRRGGEWVLNGTKHWITGAGVSRLHLIFAQAYDETGRHLGLTGFLALRDDKTLAMTRRERTMGLRGMPEGEIAIRDLVVPDEYVLRPPGGFERGFPALMNAYNSQRVGAGAAAMGVAAGATELTIEWLGKRKQFGRPLAEFQGLQWMLADMEIATTSSRLMLHAAAASQGPDQSGFPDPKLAAMAKVQAAESAIATVNTALQLHGARGYGGEFPIERMARDVRMFTIGGGTAEALRTLIASQTLGRKFPQTRDGYVAG